MPGPTNSASSNGKDCTRSWSRLQRGEPWIERGPDLCGRPQRSGLPDRPAPADSARRAGVRAGSQCSGTRPMSPAIISDTVSMVSLAEDQATPTPYGQPGTIPGAGCRSKRRISVPRRLPVLSTVAELRQLPSRGPGRCPELGPAQRRHRKSQEHQESAPGSPDPPGHDQRDSRPGGDRGTGRDPPHPVCRVAGRRRDRHGPT